MTKEEKLIADIKTLINAEDYVHEHVLLYKGIKELIEKYDEEGAWVAIDFREATEEEKEETPEAEYYFDCELPEDGEEVLATMTYGEGFEIVRFIRSSDGCVFQNTRWDEDLDWDEVKAWRSLPEPYIRKEEADEQM